MEKDRLIVLKAPFEDGPGKMWFCPQCAMIEGALMANPHWEDRIELRRVGFQRPRAEVIALLDEANQGLPVLVLRKGAVAPSDAKLVNGHHILTDAQQIASYLAATHGGATPH
jgi:hypothetical protein